MSCVVESKYSPLCDTDLTAYLAYLVSVNGGVSQRFGGSTRTAKSEGGDGGDVDSRGDVDTSGVVELEKTGSAGGHSVGVVGGVVGQFDIEHCCVHSKQRHGEAVGRLPVVFPGHCDSCVFGGGGATRRCDAYDSENWLRYKLGSALVGHGCFNSCSVVGPELGHGGDSGCDGCGARSFADNSHCAGKTDTKLLQDVCAGGDGDSDFGGRNIVVDSAFDGVAASVEGCAVVDSNGVCSGGVSADDSSVVASVVMDSTLRNRERRKKKKMRKAKRQAMSSDWRSRGDVRVSAFDGLDAAQRGALRESRAARYVAENKLAEMKARHLFELEGAKDLNMWKKRQETKCMRDTEVNKVQVEKAFSALALAGDVPGVGGSVRTVVSSSTSSASSVGLSETKSGSISPNSSVSMQEIHEMQKENLSLKVVAEKVERVKDMAPDLYQIWFGERKTMTVDTGYTCENGMPVALKGDPDLVGYIDSNKRFHYGPDPNYEEYDLDNY